MTRPEARTTVNGKHLHVFCNPLGVVYELACFAFASGLTPQGGVHHEFSWFPGHSWQIVNCARCGEHLGWCFLPRSCAGFYGLLPARLREVDSRAL
ncbi:MAG: cereblon family protein [Desulfovibrio sp.]